MKSKVLAILGSYRRDGVTAQAAREALAAAREAGAETELVDLLDARIEFCANCRACTQAAGEKRGACPLADDMAALLDKIDAADGLILAAPVNYFNVTALMRRFMERTVVYAYWPWGAAAPKPRIKKPFKKAVLITSSAMPSVMGRLFTGALRALRYAAEGAGAKVAGTQFVGMASLQERQALTSGEKRRARALGRALAVKL
jgi:NAD(P)H-dependent FMN reductase